MSMKLVRKSQAPTFQLPGLTVTGLASPRRGASETCVWLISIAPGTPGFPHTVTREEIFVALSGAAVVTVDGEDQKLEPGDAVIVPAHRTFSLANPGGEPFQAMVTFPVGGQAVTGEGAFTPPWAE